MKVVLRPGEKLEIGFADEKGRDIDGDMFVEFKPTEITAYTSWSDSDGRYGVLYSERFGSDTNYKPGTEDPAYDRGPGC